MFGCAGVRVGVRGLARVPSVPVGEAFCGAYGRCSGGAYDLAPGSPAQQDSRMKPVQGVPTSKPKESSHGSRPIRGDVPGTNHCEW